jgi:hypothetical protein
MRTTVTIDDDVYEAARVQARASGNTLGRVLSDLARKHARTQSSIRLRLGKLGKLPPSGEARYANGGAAAS